MLLQPEVKLKQIFLSQKLGVTQQCISAWFTGKRQPNLEMLQKLKEVLGCTYDELISALLSPKQKKHCTIKKREAKND